MGAIFNPKPKRDPNAERMAQQLEKERQARLELEAQNTAEAAERRTQRYGYSQLMGEGSSYAGYTSSQDKQGKKQKTRSLGGGGAV